MSALLGTRRVAQLVALRLALPRRLRREPLDELLESLTPRARQPVRTLGSGALGRGLLLIERGVGYLPGVANTCLFRSMARYALLRRSGVDAVFVMGVGKDGGDGHAWLELDGLPFREGHDVTRYAVTFRYPSEQQSAMEVS